MAKVDSDLWYLPWVAHEIEAPFDEDTPASADGCPRGPSS